MSETPEQQVQRLVEQRAGHNPHDAIAEKKAEVLRAVSEGASVVDAAASVGRDRTSIWRWRQEDADYGAAFDEAINAAQKARIVHRAEMRQGLADKALRVLHDALDGKRITREALTAAIFTAKAELGMRETASIELSGPNGGPIEHSDTSEEKLEAYAREAVGLIAEAERIVAQSSTVAREPAADGS